MEFEDGWEQARVVEEGFVVVVDKGMEPAVE